MESCKVSTVEELEKFINENENCTVIATKELDDKINRNMSLSMSRPPEDFDLFFRLHDFIEIMANKRIKYEVEKGADNG